LRRIIGEAVTHRQSEISREIGFHRYLVRMTENTLLILLIDFVDNLLSTMKAGLDLGPEFYQNVRKAHEIILECLIQRDSAAAGIAMANDLLEVGRYMAMKMDTATFDPSEIEDNRTMTDWPSKVGGQTRVVTADDPILKQQGVVSRRVGASKLFLVLSEEEVVGKNG
jgi:hypothetical protein